MTDKFKDTCTELRKEIKNIGDRVKALKQDDVFKDLPKISDQGEMMANIMLTYRHLEDARMRIGKIVQAYDGGTSVYDK